VALASYAENQIFGSTEILNKTVRYTNATAVSPKVAVYCVSKNKFFDNLGSYRVFELMKK
jgi:CRP-like cAMP-binding protein